MRKHNKTSAPVEKQVDRLIYDFMPEALEIIEKPASPLGKTVIWMLFLLITSGILWSIVGKVDTVAIARGKIIPDGNIKVIQSAETAVITAINAIEGQSVKAGDVLIHLDDTIARADLEAISSKLQTARVEKELMVTQLNGGDVMKQLDAFKQQGIAIDKTFVSSLMAYSKVKFKHQQDKIGAHTLEVKKSEQGIALAKAELNKIDSQIEILQSQVEQLKALHKEGVVTEKEVQEKVDELTLAKRQRETQEANILYNREIKEAAQQQIQVFTSESGAELYQEIIDKDKEIMDLQQQHEKATKQLALMQLKSPVDGLVQGIGNNTLGGVVTAAQPIMSIVPQDTPLLLEIMIQNRDIGFVDIGMPVEIKLDTFSYQKYGAIEGKLVKISPDAIEKEREGYVYKATVRFDKKAMQVDARTVPITPGMTATAEIKLDKKRIIDFFIPALDHVKESLKWR